MNGQYIDIIFLVIIAGLLIYRLAKVLGSNSDEADNDNSLQKAESKEKEPNKVVNFVAQASTGIAGIPEEEEIKKDPIKAVFYKMYSIDKSFNPEKFLQGAKGAFEMIVDAFGKGDEETLKNLVSKDVFKSFSKAIEDYKKKNQKIEQALIGFNEAKIIKADLKETNAELTVEFITEQSKAVMDEEGNVIEGDAVMISTVKDIWVFAKDLESSSPNWTLISTKGGS